MADSNDPARIAGDLRIIAEEITAIPDQKDPAKAARLSAASIHGVAARIDPNWRNRPQDEDET